MIERADNLMEKFFSSALSLQQFEQIRLESGKQRLSSGQDCPATLEIQGQGGRTGQGRTFCPLNIATRKFLRQTPSFLKQILSHIIVFKTEAIQYIIAFSRGILIGGSRGVFLSIA